MKKRTLANIIGSLALAGTLIACNPTPKENLSQETTQEDNHYAKIEKYQQRFAERREKANQEKSIAKNLEYAVLENEDPTDISLPMKKSTKMKDYWTINEEDALTLAKALYGESRGLPKEEQILIGYSIINRMNTGRYKPTLKGTILIPKHFSCFNEGNPNKKKIENAVRKNTSKWQKSNKLAHEIIEGKYEDKSQGATHYLEPTMTNPQWQYSMEEVGHIQTKNGKTTHKFFIEHERPYKNK